MTQTKKKMNQKIKKEEKKKLISNEINSDKFI